MRNKYVNGSQYQFNLNSVGENGQNWHWDAGRRDTYNSAAERPEPPHQNQSHQEKEHQEHNNHHRAVRLMREGTFTVSLKTG